MEETLRRWGSGNEHGQQQQRPIIIDCNQVDTLLCESVVIQHLQSALSNTTTTNAIRSPHRQHLSINDDDNAPPGTLLIMPAWSQTTAMPYIGVKIATAFPRNSHIGQPGIHASYLLSDSYTGKPVAFIDGTQLTHWRTSCISALAATYLARQDARVLAMVGAGALAPYLVKAHLAVRPTLSKVVIWNRRASKAESLARKLRGELGFLEVESGVNLDEIVGSADVISCATSSESPLVRGSLLKEGAHLDLVGSFSPSMKECDDEALANATIFVDCDAALKESGELVGAFDRGVIRPQDISGTLTELARGEKCGRNSSEQITVFKSVGTALVDLVTAQLIYEKYLQSTSH